MLKNEGYICVFDCESIVDVELVKKQYNDEGDDFTISKNMISRYKEENGSEFLPLPYHKIISICAVIADNYGKFIKVNKIEGENEEQMIRNFFNFIEKFEPRLVSFNGKNYDMPLLVLRALKYNIKASTYLDTISDKWNNYKTRFSELKHCDLFESFGGFKGLKLDLICSMANLPGKYDVSGDQVLDLFYNGKIEKIHEYCESDVLNTYMLFLKYEFIKGNLNKEDFELYLNLMCEYINKYRQNSSYKDVFLNSCKNTILSI